MPRCATSSAPIGSFTRTSTDLVHAVRHDNAKITDFDTSCFSGEYVTGDVTPEYLKRLQGERSDEAKQLRREGVNRGIKTVHIL